MITGKRFKLKDRILGVEVLDGERKAVSIPVGAIIEALTNGDQTVDVLWGNRRLETFACDLITRGSEMAGPQANQK